MIQPKNYALLTAQSMGATFASDWIPMQYYYGASIQAVWTGGSAAGTLKIQVTNIPPSTTGGTRTGTDYTGSNIVVAGAGDWFWDLTQSSCGWFRLSFTRVSGTGSLSAQVNGKTVS